MLQPSTPTDQASGPVSIHASYFFAFYDAEFVNQVYQKLLGREPDPAGHAHYLTAIRAGESRYLVIDGISRSAEAKNYGVALQGMDAYRRRKALYALPIIGQLAQAIALLWRVGALRKDLRALENHLYRLSAKAGDL